MIEKKDTFNTEILAKYFKGESTEQENTLLFEWINASEENEKHLLELRILWEAGKLTDISLNELIQNEWEKLDTKIEAHNYKKNISYNPQFKVRKLI